MAVVIRVPAAVVVATTVGFLLTLLTCAAMFIYRRFFARQSKGNSSAGSSGAEREAAGGTSAQCRALNDVIVWVFGHPAGLRWVDDWTGAWTRALTQQAARNKESSIEVRFEKVHDVHSAPQISNLSTRLLSSDKPLVLTATVEWKRIELVLSLTSKTTPNAVVCSIDCHVIVFEFQGIAEGILLSSEDGSKLSVHFPTEPKMKLEVKPNQEINIDVGKLERLVRDTISGTEVQLPLWTKNRHPSGPVTATSQREHFDSRHHHETTLTANHLSANANDRRRKLLVKVIKANGLGTSQEKDSGSLQPFCVALMDSPVQRYVTSSVKNTTNPFFDEHFVFDIDETTKKLTFELRDKVRAENDDFLGMAVLTPDDFIRTRHVLPLTGRGPMTFGALTVEVTIVDSAELPSSVLLLSPNVEHMSPPRESNTSGFGSSPTVTVSEAEAISLPALGTPTGSQMDPSIRESRSLPRFGALPPKGDAAAAKKRSTLVGAIKKRFQRKKPGGDRSQSADRVHDKTSLASSGAAAGSAFEGGIYLTPPPSRASAGMEYDEIRGDAGGGRRSRSNSVRSNLRRLFHLKRTEDSPTRIPRRGVDHSPEGSVGQSSPRLSSASASRELFVPTGTPTANESQLR